MNEKSSIIGGAEVGNKLIYMGKVDSHSNCIDLHEMFSLWKWKLNYLYKTYQ